MGGGRLFFFIFFFIHFCLCWLDLGFTPVFMVVPVSEYNFALPCVTPHHQMRHKVRILKLRL